MNEHIENLSQVVDYLDKINEYMQCYGIDSREYNIAREKLEEAVFWLTYGMEEENGKEIFTSNS